MQPEQLDHDRFDVVVAGPTAWPAIEALYLAAIENPNTLDAYRRALARWSTWCREHYVDPMAARKAHVLAFRAQLQPLAPSSIRQAMSALAGVYRMAMEDDMIDLVRNPFTGRKIRPKGTDDAQHLGLDRHQALHLLAQSGHAGTDKARRDWASCDRALAYVLLFGGFRVSEVCEADVTDLTKVTGRDVLSLTRKGGKSRHKALAPEAVAALRDHHGGRRTGPLIAVAEVVDGRTVHRRLSRHTARRRIMAIGEAAGIDRLTPHDLRHTHVTLSLEAGVPLVDVQDQADHANPSTTQGYNRARHSIERSSTYALADYLAGTVGPGGADPQLILF